MTMIAHLLEGRSGDYPIARIQGEIDASNVVWLETRLNGLLDNRSHGLIVDLADTTYLDSAGIALLFGLASTLRRHQQELRLVVVAGSPIARMVALTGLDAAVPTHESVELAAAG